MPIEQELKFRLAPSAAARAARLLPFASRPRRRRIDSVYYDTPDLRLEATRAALRLRRDGRRWWQTFKAPQGVATALAQRAEWEIPAPRGRLDVSRFPREAAVSAICVAAQGSASRKYGVADGTRTHNNRDHNPGLYL